MKQHIRFPDDTVLIFEPRTNGGVIPNQDGERVVVESRDGKVVHVGRYTFSAQEAVALTSCLLSTLFAMKEPK